MSSLRRRLFIGLVVSWLVVGFLVFSTTIKTIANVSAVEANGVGVYWDQGVTQEVASINWGKLLPGSVKNIVVYVRNEVEEPIYLRISTKNWNPPEACSFLTFEWNYGLQRIDPNGVIQITLILSVSRYVQEISTFDFDVIIFGHERVPGDVDGDGDVDVGDQRKLQRAVFSYPGDPNWNPYADFDDDGDVDIGDQRIQQNYFLINT